MNKKLCAASAVMFSLMLLACSNDNVTGSSEDPNVLTAEKNQSSGVDAGHSSSSVEVLSSSSIEREASSSSRSLVLCKVSGDWGYDGCYFGPSFSEGDLYSEKNRIVKTNVYASDYAKFGERAGEIFFETDSVDGENTQIFWSPDSSSEFSGLLSAVYRFNQGGTNKNPYFNIGFYVAGFDSDGTMLSADISNWGGICMMYRGSIDPVIQLDLGNSLNRKIGNALPSVTVTTQKDDESSTFSQVHHSTNEILCYEWSQFKQPNVEGKHDIISGEDAAKHVAKVVFHFQSKPDVDYGFFTFLAIGTNRDE